MKICWLDFVMQETNTHLLQLVHQTVRVLEATSPHSSSEGKRRVEQVEEQ